MPDRQFLTIEDLREVAAQFGLGQVLSGTSISAGTINTNHKVVTDRGAFFVRVNEGKSVSDVEYESRLVAALIAEGLPVPPALATRSGARFAMVSDRIVSVMPWVLGHHRRPEEMEAREFRAVGVVLARMHRAGLGFGDEFLQPSIYRTESIDARLRTIAADPRIRSDEPLAAAVVRLERESAWLATQAESRAALPRAVIHGDLFPDNLLFDDREGVAAVLDFEQAASGSLAYDLAVVLSAWCIVRGVFIDEARTALLAGYDSIRPRSEEEARGLVTEGRAVAYRFCVTRITDVYLPGLTREGKDYREPLQWLQTWSAVTTSEFVA